MCLQYAEIIIKVLGANVCELRHIHRVREKTTPPKQNAIKCTVYSTIQ